MIKASDFSGNRPLPYIFLGAPDQKNRLFTIKNSKHIGLGGSWYTNVVVSNYFLFSRLPKEMIKFDEWPWALGWG